MQKQWSRQQLQVLQAMDITLYQLRNEQQQSVTDGTYFYRLGPLSLVATAPLPVQLPQWLNDLCCWLEAKPIAVSQVETEHCFNLAECQQQLSSAAGKRQLWQQISAQLQSA